MKILVCVKQAATLGDEIEFTSEDRAVDPDYLDWSLNEWDAYAVEEALRTREAHGGEVVALSAGEDAAVDALRRALAMGCDRAVHVRVEEFDPLSVAAALALVANVEAADLVLTGVQSSDTVQGAVGSAIAALLDLPCVAVVTDIDWALGETVARVTRELEGGLQELLEVDLPAVLTIQTGINEPRYATLRAIKQAELREIETVDATVAPPAYRVLRMFSPPKTKGALMLDGQPETIAGRIVELIQEALA